MHDYNTATATAGPAPLELDATAIAAAGPGPHGTALARWGEYIQYVHTVRVPQRPATAIAAQCFDAHMVLMRAWLRSNDTTATDAERQAAYTEYTGLVVPANQALMELVRIAGTSTARDIATDGEHCAFLEHATELARLRSPAPIAQAAAGMAGGAA